MKKEARANLKGLKVMHELSGSPWQADNHKPNTVDSVGSRRRHMMKAAVRGTNGELGIP